jgi:hypothetical protein
VINRMMYPRLLLAGVLLLACSLEGRTQQARSFEQLQMIVKPNEVVTITEARGGVTRGKIARITDSSIAVLTRGQLKTFSEQDVLEIRQRRADPLNNGAKYGAIAGLGFGTLYAAGAVTLLDCNLGCGVLIGGLYTAVGAGIGVGIDAMIVRESTVFVKTKSPLHGFSIRPLLSPGQKAVSLVWSF